MMKISLALTALSTKLALLLCVSGMGLFGVIEDAFASEMRSPCHQEMAQDEATQVPCETCETAMEAWEENAVATQETTLTKVEPPLLATERLVENFVFVLKPFEGMYQAYYPPPLVALKAVTPITKTIVLRS